MAMTTLRAKSTNANGCVTKNDVMATFSVPMDALGRGPDDVCVCGGGYQPVVD
jgi:hypothetical protein